MNTVAPNIRMEDKLIAQVKRIYHDTKQAINECNFLSKKELDEILLTPNEEQLIMNVNGTQVSLIKAATLLRELHARFLRTFVLSAFDLTWDMITTPKRFEYAKQKELELYISLMSIANLKQDEIKAMIRDTIQSIKQTMINGSSSSSSSSSSFNIVPPASTNANHVAFSSTSSSSMQRSAMGLNLSGKFNAANCNNSLPTSVTTPTTSSTSSSVAAITTISSAGGDTRANDDQHHHNNDDDHDDHNNNTHNNSNTEDEAQQGDRDDMIDSSLDECHFNANSLDNISSRSELQLHRQEIQEYVLQQLNAEIANKLVGSVESLRNSYVGTLERCLASLEQNCVENNEPPHALLALRQILNAAYRVEVNVQSSTSLIRVLWEKMKQLVSNTLPNMWSSYYSCCIIDDQWRRQQALDIIDSLSETRLAKSICAQFRSRLKASHEQFISSLKDLELQHAGRLQHTEDLRLRVRKMHAPRMAKFALESTSLIDLILYGMPCLEKEIGRGQYGVVYACESWAGHSPCAVKSVVPPDDKHWYDLAMEFYYTRCIPEHERIVSIYGSVIDHSYGSGSTPAVLLVMSRLNRDLYSAIKSGLDWLSRLQVAIDVVEGIRFLHNQGLVHRDIKLKNILLDSNNRAKITDLGFCKPEAMMSGSVVGTPIHMSPELFSGRYDSSVDVYAFGILFWYICAGHVRLPHIFEQCQTRDQLWNCVRRGVRPERLPQFDNECWQLMSQCWEGDRLKRPHLGDVEIKLRQIYARYN